MVREAVNFIQIVNQQSARLRRGDLHSVQINLFAPVVSTQANEIPLVGYYVIEFVLVEETA